MRLSIKLALTAILGISALIALFLFESFSNKYFIKRNAFESLLSDLESEQKKLDYEVLHSAFFVYSNYDITNQKIETVSALLEKILTDRHLIEQHKGSYEKFKLHSELNEIKKQKIYDFQTVNSIIKNSTTAILALQTRLFKLEALNQNEQDLFREINQVTSTILLAKNSMDLHMIDLLHTAIENLNCFIIKDEQKKQLLKGLITHFKIIEDNFYPYVILLKEIIDPHMFKVLQDGIKEFGVESDGELRWINYFSYILVSLFITSIGLISYFHIRSENLARSDSLTKLKNRIAYEEAVKNSPRALSLILLNISKFKHYNDFYGTHEGDLLLIKTANRIKNMGFKGMNASYYRLGADDFGILFEESAKFPIDQAAKNALELFASEPIIINGEDRTPLLSVAAANTEPLLENANMALKSKKQQNPIIYHSGLNLRALIEENVLMSKELKEALEENRVVPYYQPIVEVSCKKPTKHEVLARVITKNGEARSIYPYLRVAKESRLYNKLTETIIKKSFEVVAKSSGEFSINLSIEDIENMQTVELIITLLRENQDIGKRIIFEILESEAADKYEGVVNFITLVRRFGCKIAIDDFGSGYSNFARILNLAVDIIKIDGSLIRHLDSDPKAKTIVETIVAFTQNASISTVAEFVHNEEIATIVEELGIDSAQGYYFYEPSSKPVAV